MYIAISLPSDETGLSVLSLSLFSLCSPFSPPIVSLQLINIFLPFE